MTLPILTLTLFLSLNAWALPSVGRWMLYGHAGYAITRPGKDGKGSALVPQDRSAMISDATFGSTYGAGAAYRVTEHLLVGGEVNFLDTARNLPEGLYLPAIETGLTFKYAFALTPRLALSAGVMAGPILAFGGHPLEADAAEWSGLGFSCQGLVSGDLFIDEHVSLGLDAGYRFATIANLKPCDDGASHPPICADYSGPILRLGIRVYF